MDVSTITATFYEAVWDFSKQISCLPGMINVSEYPKTPNTLLAAFKEKALPFLDLQGTDIPQHLHTEFDQIDTTVREEVFPALGLLQEEWDIYAGISTEEDTLYVASMCAQVLKTLELIVIPNASYIERALVPSQG